MKSSCRCVLGQLIYSYGPGLRQLGLSYDQAWEYGFDLTNQEVDDVDSTGIAYAWAKLDELWLGEIKGGLV